MLQLPGPIAVIDVETTGLFPWRHDRIVEIAAVVVNEHGMIEREFVSLVNPQRDVGPTRIHGLTAEDVLHAPPFCDIAPLLVFNKVKRVALPFALPDNPVDPAKRGTAHHPPRAGDPTRKERVPNPAAPGVALPCSVVSGR
jgi:hypothetical protein